MSSNKEQSSSSSSTESGLDFDPTVHKRYLSKKSATQNLDTENISESISTDSENENPKKTPPELNYRQQIFQSQGTVNLSSSSDEGNVPVDTECECQSQLSVEMPGPSNKPMETRFECTQDTENESQYIFIPSHNKKLDLPGPSCKPLAKPTSCEVTQHEDDGDDEFESETTHNSSSDTVIASDTQNETERLSQYVVGEPTQYQSQDLFPQTLSQPSPNLERSDRRKSDVNYLHSSDASSSSIDQDFVPFESEIPELITRQNAMYIQKSLMTAKRNIESTDSSEEFPPTPKKIAYCTDKIL